MKGTEKGTFFLIECVHHDFTRWDIKEQKDVPARLFLNGEGRLTMSPDVMWLTAVTRPDSGTWFTSNETRAMRFDSEAEADERVATLVLELGYLPGDLTAFKVEPKSEEEQEG